jgi:hypothetical protein
VGLFGTEHKLSGLDPLLQNLRLRIRRVDGEILDAVRQQSTSGNRAKEDLDHANRAIQVRALKCRYQSERANTHPLPPPGMVAERVHP